MRGRRSHGSPAFPRSRCGARARTRRISSSPRRGCRPRSDESGSCARLDSCRDPNSPRLHTLRRRTKYAHPLESRDPTIRMDGGRMTKFSLRALVFSLILVLPLTAFAQMKSVLFDAAHAQTAGNADWTLDEDSCGTAQRYPTPDQSGITSSTAETYWSGGFSAMGVALVKKGFHVESLPAGPVGLRGR